MPLSHTAPLAADSAPPTPTVRQRVWRRLWPWLLGSLVLHLALLLLTQPASSEWKSAAPGTAKPFRLQAAPPAPRPVSTPKPSVTPATRPAPAPKAVAAPPTPAASAAPAPVAPPPEPASAASPDDDAIIDPDKLPKAGDPGTENMSVPLTPSAQWPFELTFGGERGDALLSWEREGLGYRLTLERRTAKRTLPLWTSTGTVSLAGLVPGEFESRGPRRKVVRLAFDSAQATVDGPSGLQSTPPMTQDRLSWLLQLSAVLQTNPSVRAIEITVVDWKGRPQPWRLDWVAEEPVLLADGRERLAQRWRRQEIGEAQAEIEMWLDPELGYFPLRLLHKVRGDDRWELRIAPAGVPMATALPASAPAALPTPERPSAPQPSFRRDQSPTSKAQ